MTLESRAIRTSTCVVFDLDGTLVETEQIWRDERRSFVAAHGGRWPNTAQDAMIGMRTVEWARYIHDDLGVAMAPEEIARIVVASVVERLRHHIPVLPGARAALERLGGAFRLALATSAAPPVAQAALEETGWNDFFEVVVSADEVARGKPAADVYLRALECLRCDPAHAVAVEDSANGIRSADAARLPVIAVPNHEFAPDSDALRLASRVIPNLDALDIELVRSLTGD